MVEETGVKRLIYLHDYGNGWEHTIRIERIVAALPGELYPRLLDAGGRRPPEDICGPPGYAEFIEALADPNHGAPGWQTSTIFSIGSRGVGPCVVAQRSANGCSNNRRRGQAFTSGRPRCMSSRA